jgi:hypothetical protein
MARNRGGASHHSDVECAYAGLEGFLVVNNEATKFLPASVIGLAPNDAGIIQLQDRNQGSLVCIN